jgi:DNA-binding beta-propeller fold protein YncE
LREEKLKPVSAILVALLVAAGMPPAVSAAGAPAQPAEKAARPLPVWELDPDWPKIPANFKVPFVSEVLIDAQDNAWLITRPGRSKDTDPKKIDGPSLMLFDPNGNYIRGFGGPGPGYDWPQSPHSAYIDHKGFVWVTGDSCKSATADDDEMIVKFTLDGKFVMQIGHKNGGKGDGDTENFRRPPNVQVNPLTNELFVADGYGNHRIIVLDADTGKFKRMWGAFGNPPTAAPPNDGTCFSRAPKTFEGDGRPYFSTPHVLLLSHDNLLYVADRDNQRIQVFTPEGKYIRQLALYDDEFAHNLVFSTDPEQTFIYAGYGDGMAIIDRKSMQLLGTVKTQGGDGHQIAIDSKNNLYLTGNSLNRPPGKPTVERLIYKGMSTQVRQ